jgi:hypothetical protein
LVADNTEELLDDDELSTLEDELLLDNDELLTTELERLELLELMLDELAAELEPTPLPFLVYCSSQS